MTNRQIAKSLMVTERTVKAHVKELMRRLGASNRTQVVAIASAYP
ncbi:response regulator transcription factor, partial [Sphingomonas koreensis]